MKSNIPCVGGPMDGEKIWWRGSSFGWPAQGEISGWYRLQKDGHGEQEYLWTRRAEGEPAS